MKLYDWLVTKDIADPLDLGTNLEIRIGDIEGLTKGLHVIGTCGECKYWGDRDIAWDEDARPYRICENENEDGNKDGNMGIFSPIQRRSNAFLKDFGCIHFEGKGEK